MVHIAIYVLTTMAIATLCSQIPPKNSNILSQPKVQIRFTCGLFYAPQQTLATANVVEVPYVIP